MREVNLIVCNMRILRTVWRLKFFLKNITMTNFVIRTTFQQKKVAQVKRNKDVILCLANQLRKINLLNKKDDFVLEFM